MALFPIKLPKIKLKKKNKSTIASQKEKKKAKKKKNIRIFKLVRRNQQKKTDKQLVRAEAKDTALQKQEEEMSPEIYVDEAEALGPTVYNEGYMKKAAFFRNLRYGIILVLVLFLIGMLNLYREEITIENFRYLLRNVNFELRIEMGETGSISYTSNDTNAFAIYRSSLAQISDRQIAIYDAGGRTSYTGTLSYQSPAICASDKYVLAYDRSGGSYSLYTTFSQAHSASTGYPITDADLADNGVYVIASRSKEYFGTVEVYNVSFQLMNKIQKNKYIASVDLSADGKMLLIASYYVGDEGIETEIMTLAVDSDEPTLLFTIPGILPWEAAWMEPNNGEFVLICEEGVKFFNSKGKICNEYGFLGENVIEYSVNSAKAEVAVVTRQGVDTSATRVVLLNNQGKVLHDASYTEPIQSTAITYDGLILLFKDTAHKIADGKTTVFSVQDTLLQTVVHSADTLYLCTPTRAILPEWKTQ